MNLRIRHLSFEKALALLTIGCIAAYLVVFGIINFLGFPLFCDSDMYADTFVAKLMWEQKTLFPEGWTFGNQYYVLATPVVAAVFYGITGNTNTAMALATTLMTVLVILSLFYLLCCITKVPLNRLTAILLLLSIICAPYGVYYGAFSHLLFLLASYYACYLITLFVVLGDYIRSIHSPAIRPFPWILSLFLCWAMGMQSLRQTVIMILPVLVCESLLALRRLFLKERTAGKFPLSLIRALSYFAANLAGIITIRFLDIPHFTIIQDAPSWSIPEIFLRIRNACTAFYDISGLHFVFGDRSSFFYLTFAIFLIGLFVGAAVLSLKDPRKFPSAAAISWLICLIGVAGTALATIVTSTIMRPVYLFTWFPTVVFSLIIVMSRLPQRPRQALILLVCVLSLANLHRSYEDDVKRSINTCFISSQAPEERPLLDISQEPVYVVSQDSPWALVNDSQFLDAKQLCQWAIDEGYQYVYGGWFVAPRIAVHSGGKLITGLWETPFQPLEYLNLQNIYGPEANAKAIYVFTPEDESSCLALARERGCVMEKVTSFGRYSAYVSSIAMMNTPD